MAKKITIELGKQSISDAIAQIKAYRAEIKRKTERLAERIANEISEAALFNFASAVCDDRVVGGSRPANVTIAVETAGDARLVIASGEDAVFCEFGAGVTHNVPAGDSLHPNGVTLGMTIGSYGKGFGSRRVWGYYDDGGGLVLTRGTPASMPMYNAMKTVCEQITTIAQEVFA